MMLTMLFLSAGCLLALIVIAWKTRKRMARNELAKALVPQRNYTFILTCGQHTIAVVFHRLEDWGQAVKWAYGTADRLAAEEAESQRERQEAKR